jgi:iron(III) transport system ATP-binding protein
METSTLQERAHAEAAEPFLRIENVTKAFGAVVALRNISLTIDEGDFVCFLGPSGCGKTTLLRAIAGLDLQTSGRISRKGEDISDLPPAQRDYGIVFQSYALFPNLTVTDNVAYGLRGMTRAERKARVEQLLDLVGLPGSGSKYPAALSGGQQQRVALARALATSPSLLLLDEPLSALDAQVRLHLRSEVKKLQRTLGITTIMVTHDQEEALSMADKIVVMNHGVIEQMGTPREIYGSPASAYVASFVGAMNFLPGEVQPDGAVRVGALEIDVEGDSLGYLPGTPVTVCIRPEDVVVRGADRLNDNVFSMEVDDVEFLGSFCRVSLLVKGCSQTRLTADFSINLMRDFNLSSGQPLQVALPRARLCLYPGQESAPVPEESPL